MSGERDQERADTRAKPLPASFTAARDERDAADGVAFTVDHPYFERCYTPSLGPSAVLLLRYLVDLTQRGPVGIVSHELAVAIGARANGDGPLGRRSPLTNAIRRLERAKLATWRDNVLVVSTHVPPLSDRALTRLPAQLQALHHDHLARSGQNTQR